MGDARVDRGALESAVAELLADYPVVVTTMVAWGDMDANGHVNNTVYFRYLEHARLQCFTEMGFMKVQAETGVGPILSWTDCRFRRALTYPDTVSIGTRIRDVQHDRFEMESVIVSHAMRQVAAQGQQRVVMYDYRQNQKAPLPESIRQGIGRFEKHP